MRLYSGEKLPKTEQGQYSVIFIDPYTGHILNAYGKKRDTKSLEPWVFIFDTLDKARKFAYQQVLTIKVQCGIFDFNGTFVECHPPMKYFSNESQ